MAFNFEEALSGFKTEAGRYSRRLKSASVPEGLSARTAVNHNSALMSAHRATTGVLSQVMDAKYAPYAAAGVLGAGALAANNLAGNFAYNHPMARVPVAGLKLAGLGAAILDPALMPSLLRSGIKAGAQTVGRAAEKTNAAGFANVGKTLENKARTLRPPVAIEASAVVAKAQAEAPTIVLKPSQTPTRVVSDSEQISAGFDARETAAASSRSMDHASGVESRQSGYEEKKSQRASAAPSSLTPTFPPQHSLTPSVQEPLTVEKFDEAMAAPASPRPGEYKSARLNKVERALTAGPGAFSSLPQIDQHNVFDTLYPDTGQYSGEGLTRQAELQKKFAALGHKVIDPAIGDDYDGTLQTHRFGQGQPAPNASLFAKVSRVFYRGYTDESGKVLRKANVELYT